MGIQGTEKSSPDDRPAPDGRADLCRPSRLFMAASTEVRSDHFQVPPPPCLGYDNFTDLKIKDFYTY